MEEIKLIEQLKKQFPDMKIMTTELYRQRIRRGQSTDGYNFYMAGEAGYAWTRLTYNAVLQCEDEESDPFNVVRAGHPLPGIYKIASIDGLNDTRAINSDGHGYHHSNQILSCYYSKCSTTNFVTEETVDIFAYPLWQSVAARDVDRLDIGDVFEVLSFDLIDTPYTCYRLQWHLVSKSARKSEIFSCATEGVCLPHVNTSKPLISELQRVRDKIAQRKNLESYKIFSNKTLQLLASTKPQNFDELLSISGIGEYKMNAYGGWILYVIKCFKTAKTTKNTSKTASSSRVKNSNGASSKQQSLETLLTEYRTNQSQEEMVPAYCIFSNAVMQSIIAEKPKTRTALLAIHGFGPVKYDKYGEDIIRIIKQATMKSSPKTDTVQITVDMYDEGLSPEQIAEERGLTYQTIHNHLFKAGVVDPRDILSEHEYNDAYILWENSQVDVILEIYGHAGVAAFYFIRNNQLY
jgi:hypothetical protein